MNIYSKGIFVRPRFKGRLISKYDKKMFLRELYPLEEYDKIIILLSGGKDSVACLLYILDLGVPKERIELWHHDIDGESEKPMDWLPTKNYCKALAAILDIPIRFS